MQTNHFNSILNLQFLIIEDLKEVTKHEDSSTRGGPSTGHSCIAQTMKSHNLMLSLMPPTPDRQVRMLSSALPRCRGILHGANCKIYCAFNGLSEFGQ